MSGYCGWLRQAGGRWRQVCQAASEGECWADLLRTPRAGNCDMTVLLANEHPTRALRSDPPAPVGGSHGWRSHRSRH